MNVLVTGATGFIGSHVVEALREAGHSQVIMGRREMEKVPKGALFALADIVDYEAIAEAVSKADAVIHLAGLLGTTESIQMPEAFVQTNVFGSINVFDACRFFAKPCIYGGIGNIDDNNMYAISKYTAERLALMYNKEHRTRILPVRIFNVYGERQKTGPVRKLVPSAIVAAIEDQPITVYGDGQQQNDFIYVKDVARILVKALETEQFDPLAVWQLGTGLGTPILDVVKSIVRLSDSKSEIKLTGQARPGENTRVLVADRAGFIIPDYPFTPLDAGLRPTIEYFRTLSHR
jgi:UDP-glucose 4-epimerase